MKILVARDFTVEAEVPEGTKLSECEVVICKAEVIITKDGKSTTLTYDENKEKRIYEVGINVISTRIECADGGEIIEEE